MPGPTTPRDLRRPDPQAPETYRGALGGQGHELKRGRSALETPL